MNMISRRDVIRGSGLAALAPMLAGRHAEAQIVQSTTQLPADFAGTYSPDLIAYANEAHFNLLVKLKRGRATKSDLLHSAGANRLVARHLERLNIDPIAAYCASKVDSTKTDFRGDPQVDALYAILQSRESSFTREEVARDFKVPADAMEAGKHSLMQHGLTYQLHYCADTMYKVAHLMRGESPHISIGDTHAHAIMSDAVFEIDKFDQTRMASKPRLIYVQNSILSQCQKKICPLLGDGDTRTATAALIALGMASYGKMGANAFCLSDAIGSLAADIASMGWGTTASGVEAGLCGGAQAYATLSATRGGIIVNTLAVKKTLSAVADWFGCS